MLVGRFLKLSRDHIILPVYLKTPTWLPEEYGAVFGGPRTNVSYHFGDMKQIVLEWEPLLMFNYRDSGLDTPSENTFLHTRNREIRGCGCKVFW